MARCCMHIYACMHEEKSSRKRMLEDCIDGVVVLVVLHACMHVCMQRRVVALFVLPLFL